MYESSNYVPIRFYSKEEEEMIISEQEFIEMGDKPQSNNYDFCQDFLNFEENLDPSLSLPPFFEPQVTNQEIIVKKPFIQTEQTDNGHFQVLQNRILELEARIHDLEFEKQSVSLQNNTNSTVSNSLFSVIQNNNNNSFDYKIKINDFSPEWDFVEGGSKMMICFSPIQMILTEDQNNKLSVLFGDIEVKAFCIQPGVIKCYGIYL